MTTSTVRLKYLVDINPETLPETTDPEYEFGYLDIGSIGRGVIASDPEMLAFGAAPSRARRLVRQGDTIISTVRTYLRAVWPVNAEAEGLVVSTGFAVLRPRKPIDGRFLGWLAQSDPVIEEIVARSVGVSYPALNAAEIGDIRVPVVSLDEQRRVADFLDGETARIDSLVAKKRRMVALCEERRDSALLDLFARWNQVPLRRVSKRIDVGIAEAATHAYADDGVTLIRSTNIRREGLDLSDLLHIEPWFAERNRSKYIHANDIVTVRTGNAGVSAVVPPELEGSQCFTQLITTLSDGQSSGLICAALNYGESRRYFAEAGWGSAQANISVPLLASAPVPLIPLLEQPAALQRVARIIEVTSQMVHKLKTQLELMGQHRLALIDGAVRGKQAA